MRLIDADALYEQLKKDEDKVRDQVINMPSNYPDGSLNPQVINFLIQLTKIAWFKKIVYNAPTIEPERIEEHPTVAPDPEDGLIIRCRDCKYNANTKKCLNPDSFFTVPADDDFCSLAERREE